VAKERKRVLIVGGGTMGAGVSVVFLAGDWAVEAVSPSEKTRASLPARVEQGLQRMGKPFDPARLRVHADYAAVPWDEVGIVVENVSEDLALKQRVFTELVGLAPRDIPLTSNASSFPISAIGRGLETRERMMGLHFYMPAFLVPLVEVVRSERTDTALAERVGDWMWALGKRPVQVVRDIEGFLANRIQHALIREAVNMVQLGIASPQDVDAAIRYSFGFRLAVAGPLLQREHAGWDMSYAVAKSLYPHLSSMDAPPPVVEDMVKAGHYGMKTGRGFYAWDKDSIAREKERYERALQTILRIFAEEGLQ
jgi:3-hydroxybutyryl-CoA dehydrogenase